MLARMRASGCKANSDLRQPELPCTVSRMEVLGFQSVGETTCRMFVSSVAPAPSKRRRAMAAVKQIPVSMLSGFLGSGADTALHSVTCA